MDVNVIIERKFQKKVDADWLKRIAEKALVFRGVDEATEVGLLITTQEKIEQLNQNYLGEDRPTDVLSFAMIAEPLDADPNPFVVAPDGVQHLGEIIISYPQAVIQAEDHKHSVNKEIAILVVHGVHHLLGYDHDVPEREKDMKTHESEVLSSIVGEIE